jgi:hypothetical protein
MARCACVRACVRARMCVSLTPCGRFCAALCACIYKVMNSGGWEKSVGARRKQVCAVGREPLARFKNSEAIIKRALPKARRFRQGDF